MGVKLGLRINAVAIDLLILIVFSYLFIGKFISIFVIYDAKILKNIQTKEVRLFLFLVLLCVDRIGLRIQFVTLG
ncbi:hypothetical protein AXF22_13025 [Prevotella scopos JCM 17725]|nr:hypothetical protein AXF22_13025 [Prevotella scopos JCM 17725]